MNPFWTEIKDNELYLFWRGELIFKRWSQSDRAMLFNRAWPNVHVPFSSAMELVPWDRIDATFKPKRTDDLKPGVADWIGYRGEWLVRWEITEEDGGSYVGDVAVGFPPDVLLEKDELPPFAWVPGCDLEVHEILRPS